MIVSLLLGALVVLAVYVGSKRLSGGVTAGMLGLAALGALLVISPILTSRVAQALGVGRGTDLLVYVAIVAGLFAAANLYFRSKKQEQQIAELTRTLALLEATLEGVLDARLPPAAALTRPAYDARVARAAVGSNAP